MELEIGNDMTDVDSVGDDSFRVHDGSALTGKLRILAFRMFEQLAVLAQPEDAFEQQRLRRRLRWLKQLTGYTTSLHRAK